MAAIVRERFAGNWRRLASMANLIAMIRKWLRIGNKS